MRHVGEGQDTADEEEIVGPAEGEHGAAFLDSSIGMKGMVEIERGDR